MNDKIYQNEKKGRCKVLCITHYCWCKEGKKTKEQTCTFA